jgi:ABC-type transport system involved in cytochrome c biogenesis ATPase subunit
MGTVRVYHQGIEKLDACQIILTTHDTSVMTNELMRPDCLFLMHKNSIRSAADSTEKKLRFAHDVEKMYRAGAFND